MPTQTERNYAEEVVLSEAVGSRSREVVTILSGQNLKAGAVLGKVTASGKYKQCDNTTPASDGSQTAAAVLLEAVDASGGDKKGVALVRDAEVKTVYLEHNAGASGPNKTAQIASLATVGIIAR